MAKAGAQRQSFIEQIHTPDDRVSGAIRSALRAIRQGKTISMEEARVLIEKAAAKRISRKKRTHI